MSLPICPPPIRRRDFAVATGAALLGWPAARAESPVRVASKIDTEGALLGQLILAALAAHGIATDNRLQLGPTKIVRTALVAGEIDLYPEYTGNGAFFFADEHDAAWRDLQAGYERVRSLDAQRNRLVWLPPAPANNTWAIAVRRDVAAEHGLVAMEDFSRWVNGGGAIRLAASAEFVERSDALPAFEAAYGFKLRPSQLLVLAGGDTAVTIKAAAQHTSGVDASMAYGTDGALAALGLVILRDSLAVQPVYAPSPVVRAEVLARRPAIAPALAPVFAALDAPTLQTLNARIAVEGRDAKAVAAAWLQGRGLLR